MTTASQESQLPRQAHGGEYTILLVDDDRVDVRAVRRSMRKAGVPNPIVCAPDGIEALRLLRGEVVGVDVDPHRLIVLLDLKMPRMGGFEFLEELRADPALRETPVIVYTTSQVPEDLEAARQYEVVGYVSKSNRDSAAEATARIRRYLELDRSPQAH